MKTGSPLGSWRWLCSKVKIFGFNKVGPRTRRFGEFSSIAAEIQLFVSQALPPSFFSAQAAVVRCRREYSRSVEVLESRELLSALTPAQVTHAYAVDQIMFGSIRGTGSGQTIAIVDAYDAPDVISDLATFNSTYNLPNTDGAGATLVTKATPQGTPAYNAGWAQEITLDVEWAHAIAPGAHILLVEAATASLNDLLAAVSYASAQPGVSVVSMSWGAAEFSGESGYNSYFTTPTGHSNVSFIASAGDTGAITEWPSVSSNVVAVGGTQLTIADSAGTYGSEIAWSGSGGGVSLYEAKPPFQSGVTQSNTNRASPDVAWDASPSTGVSVYFSGQSTGSGAWYTFGGTSVGAPSWAGVIAIADQGRVLAGQSPLDGPTQLLPALYSLPSSDFHDITSGTAASGSKSNSTGMGYDLVTGRGTPYADLVVAGLVSWNSTSPPSPPPTPPVGTPTLTATAVNTTTAQLSWNSVSGSPQGYRIYKIVGSTTTLVATVGSSTTSYQVSGLTPGSRVSFKVEAYNSSSIADSQIVALTMPVPPPVVGTPTLTARAVSSTGALLTWNPVSGSPQGYRIYKIIGSTTTLVATVSTSTTSYQVNGLTAGSRVSFKLEAYNSNSIADSQIVALTMPPAPPVVGAPALTARAVNSTTALLSWNSVSGSPQGYRIYKISGSNTTLLATVSTSTTSYQVTGLTAGLSVRFKVEAYNSNSIADSQVVALSMPVPAPPTTPQVRATAVTRTSAVLSWNAVSGAQGIHIYLLNGSQRVLLGTYGSSTTTVQLTGMAAGSTYKFMVEAYNGSAIADSAWISVITSR